MKRTRTRENGDEQGCPVEFMYRQTGRENYPPVDEIVLVVGVMADHRRFQTSSSHALLYSIPPNSRGKHKPGEGGGEAPINFQLYTHHDRNSTLLFPLVTRRCTWRTISFLHHRERGGESIQREKRRLSSALPYLASLTFILCRATLPSFYLSWRRDRCISRHTIYGADGWTVPGECRFFETKKHTTRRRKSSFFLFLFFFFPLISFIIR